MDFIIVLCGRPRTFVLSYMRVSSRASRPNNPFKA